MQSTDLLATIDDLVAMAPRATGTPGGEAAAEYVAARFRAAGLHDVHFLEVPSYAWHATTCSLRVAGSLKEWQSATDRRRSGARHGGASTESSS